VLASLCISFPSNSDPTTPQFFRQPPSYPPFKSRHCLIARFFFRLHSLPLWSLHLSLFCPFNLYPITHNSRSAESITGPPLRSRILALSENIYRVCISSVNKYLHIAPASLPFNQPKDPSASPMTAKRHKTTAGAFFLLCTIRLRPPLRLYRSSLSRLDVGGVYQIRPSYCAILRLSP